MVMVVLRIMMMRRRRMLRTKIFIGMVKRFSRNMSNVIARRGDETQGKVLLAKKDIYFVLLFFCLMILENTVPPWHTPLYQMKDFGPTLNLYFCPSGC